MSVKNCRQLLSVVVVLFSCIYNGCGSKDPGPELTPVTGVVVLNEQPLFNADLFFIPVETTPGVGGKPGPKNVGSSM